VFNIDIFCETGVYVVACAQTLGADMDPVTVGYIMLAFQVLL
jgi:hypothetical protein